MERTLRQTIDRVREMLDPTFDWNAYWESELSNEEDSLDKLFRACIDREKPEESEAKRYISCGSAEVQDTPAGLYRILYLVRPKRLDFSDMYKGSLLFFRSQDKRFWIDIGFYKYEMDIRFYALRELVDTSEGHGVYCGVPGHDNGFHLINEDDKAFFDMVVGAVHHEWSVYPGNDFCV